jgi:hypothetical protein
MTQAAERYLSALSAEQLGKAKMGFDDPERTKWHFIPKPERKGLQIRDMNPQQRKLAHALLHSGLSEVGYEKATTIMSLEAILHELEKPKKSGMIRDTERYYFTVFGDPKPQGSWGWSVEGHHLSLNFAVRDGKVHSATPAFFGANPAIIKSDLSVGPAKGKQTLAKEENLAFDLLRSLAATQRQVAVVASEAPSELTGAEQAQAPRHEQAGLPVAKMSESQRRTLWSLLEAYAGNMPEEVGLAWLDEIKKAGVESVAFAWAGGDRPGTGHYYRVQGPTFVLEFINVQADSAGNPANHIHSVWRNLLGDFGIAI